jgi:hypothetical protein
MIGIIREHNTLNGLRFSALEYGVVGAGLGLLTAWYVLAGRWLEAIGWFGIVANCAVIVVIAVHAIRAGEADFGIFPMRRAEFRERIARDHPGLNGHTTVLVLGSLVPYLILVLALVDRVRSGR